MTYLSPSLHRGLSSHSRSQAKINKYSSPYPPNKNIMLDDDSIHNYREMEDILIQDRNKFKDFKDRFETQLDNERKVRISLQNKLIKLKEEYSKKDLQVSDLQFKENAVLNQNQNLCIDNERLKNQIAGLQDASRDKIFDLQNKLATETRQSEEAAFKYDSQFEKFKKEGLEYVENLTQEYEKKLKGLEQKTKAAQAIKRGFTAENKRLGDLVLSNQLNFDTQLRETINRIRDEESRKSQYNSKSFQQRMKSSEESKESMARKIQELNKTIQTKDKAYEDLMNQKFEQSHRLNQQLGTLENQRQQVNSAYQKLKADLAQRSAKQTYTSYDTNNTSDMIFLKQQLENKKRQVDGLKDLIRQLKQSVKEAETDGGRHRQQLSERVSFFQSQTKKYRDLYQKLCEKLKLKINESINTICYSRP